MQAEGQVFVYNTTCPSDIHEFQDDLASALANATNATNATAVLDHCYASYTAANYTLTLPISDADKYDNASSLSNLSSLLAAELRNRGYNNSGAEMLVGMLLFNPADGVECTLKQSDSACKHGESLRTFEVSSPAKFGGNCTIPDSVIMSCNSTSSSGLDNRQIAGIVIGSVIGGLLLLIICCCLLCRSRSRARRGSKQPATPVAPQSDAVRA
jgi:hypothetical protein